LEESLMPSRAVIGFAALTLAFAAGPAPDAATGTPPATAPKGTQGPATGKPAPAKPAPATAAKPAPAPAKATPAAGKPKPGDEWVTALETSLQRSTAALHRYEWTETTVVTVRGEAMPRRESRCRIGPNGKVVRDDVEAAADTGGKKAPAGRGRAVTQVESLPDAVEEAVALVKQYLPLEPARIQAARDAGRVTVKSPDAQGKAHITIADYIKGGDSVAIDLDTAKNHLAGVAVSTFTDKVKHAGTIKMDVASLSDGTVYPSSAVLDIKDEGVTVAVTSGGHKKTPLPD
jgi:hypothetical protein